MFKEMLALGFMQRALIVGVLISLCSSLIGLFLVLRRYSMIGDGLAHVSFASVAIALLLGLSPLSISLPIVILASIFILVLSQRIGVHADAAIALISSFSVAVGVIITSISSGFNVDIYSYLFGSILLISKTDVWITLGVSILIMLVIAYFYRDLVSISFDEEFAQVMNLPVKRYNYLLSILTAVTVVIGIRIVGTMLISALIIFAPLSALQLRKGFKMTVVLSALISLICVLLGIFSSYIWNLPTGSTIVFINGIAFLLCFGVKKITQ